MKILSVDSSAKCASAAITENDAIIYESFSDSGLTHSKTLLVMVDEVLNNSGLTFKDIDAFAVNNGPGSFTGIRIGVSLIKGLAFTNDKLCAGVSTLESIAYNFLSESYTVCACMDARCNQVYTAIFKCENGQVQRICADEAISVDELKEKLLKTDGRIILAGDGAEITYPKLSEIDNIDLADKSNLYQRASSVGIAASKNNHFFESSKLVPSYLRLPQAERELKKRR